MKTTSNYKNILDLSDTQEDGDIPNITDKFPTYSQPGISAGKNKIMSNINIDIKSPNQIDSISESGQYTYNIETLLNKNFEDLDFTPNTIHFCFYRINDRNNRVSREGLKKPFLQYLLFKYPKNDKKHSNLLVFPFIKYNPKHSITKSSDEYTKKIFGKTIKSEGFIEKNRDIYLFFNFNTFYKNIKRILFLTKETTYWWCLIDEICNHQSVLYYPVHSSVYTIFYKNPLLIYLKNNENKTIEIPRVAFIGEKFDVINNIIILPNYTKYNSEKDSVQFYLNNFSSLDHSFKNGIINYYHKHYKEGEKNEGGIIRYALFLGGFGKTKLYIDKEIKEIINNINSDFKSSNNNSIIISNACFNKKCIVTHVEYFFQGYDYYSLSFHKIDLEDKCPIWDKNQKYNLV